MEPKTLPNDKDAFIFGYCFGVNADHKITQAESKAFIELLKTRPELLEAKILISHRKSLSKLINVSEIWRSHCEKAEEVIYSILGVSKLEQAVAGAPLLQFDRPAPDKIKLTGANVVFTGEFHMGRTHAEEVGALLGANPQGSTNVDTEFVIVGSIPSPAWKFGKFGTKVARAIHLKERGSPILIISEDTFLSAIPKGLIDKVQTGSSPFKVEGFEIERLKRQVAGKTFVITGTLPTLSRERAFEVIELAGGKISGSVTSQTDYVVYGDEAGSKLEKARRLGVTAIDETMLLRLLKEN